MSKEFIKIGGAREHNLKNLTLTIPRDKLVVVTGLSGSGKSSLAFDTIYAEGQRKYVESLSAYARQFLDQLQKPDVDFIEGLSPAIAIEQRSSGSNARSIIATTTEIYDYLRLLYAHIGRAHCPETGVPISTQSTSDIVDKILALPPKTRVMLLAPVVRRQKGEFRDVFERLARDGYVRVRVDGEISELGENVARIKLDKKKFHNLEVVVDRLVIDDKIRVRLGDSVQTALRLGEGVMFTLHQLETGRADQPAASAKSDWIETLHSNKMCSPATGKSYDPPTTKHFSFNAPAGACPVCHGLGQKMVFDEALVVPDMELPLDGAIQPWRRAGKRLIIYYKAMLRSVAAHFNVSTETPYKDLPGDFKHVLLNGSGEDEIEFKFWRGGKVSSITRPFEGVLPNLERLATDSESEFIRNRLKAYMTPQFCDACKGKRLKPEILAVTLGALPPLSPGDREKRSRLPGETATASGSMGFQPPQSAQLLSPLPWGEGQGEGKRGSKKSKRIPIPGLSIMDVCGLSVEKADEFFAALKLTEFEQKIAAEVIKEIRARLGFLRNVGLAYLTLDRESGTLSGGEAQRIRLATQIGAALVGVLYVLDEPSIGLHQRDNDRLLATLKGLRDLGNTVLVVEHDADTIRAADYILDLGPGAGVHGGELVAAGTLPDILAAKKSLTGQYLTGELEIPIPKKRLVPTEERGWLEVLGCSENNLQNIDVRIPLGTFTCVTGVIGS